MKYINAKTVFPQSLLDEMQKYIQGECVYIPKIPTNYKKWGTDTDSKNKTAQRNNEILQAFKTGASVYELSCMYHLSEETIKKIVYCQKQ